MVLDKSEYMHKMTIMLNNRDTYQTVEKDPTKANQNEINTLLRGYKEHEHLYKTLHMSLSCSNGRMPRKNGNPKTHQEGLPLRPIASFYTSLTYHLLKHLCWLLTPLLGVTDLW